MKEDEESADSGFAWGTLARIIVGIVGIGIAVGGTVVALLNDNATPLLIVGLALVAVAFLAPYLEEITVGSSEHKVTARFVGGQLGTVESRLSDLADSIESLKEGESKEQEERLNRLQSELQDVARDVEVVANTVPVEGRPLRRRKTYATYAPSTFPIGDSIAISLNHIGGRSLISRSAVCQVVDPSGVRHTVPASRPDKKHPIYLAASFVVLFPGDFQIDDPPHGTWLVRWEVRDVGLPDGRGVYEDSFVWPPIVRASNPLA